MKDIERNKILARFLGYEYTPWNSGKELHPIGWNKVPINKPEELMAYKGCYHLGRSHNDLPFDSDWNWIMKVIEKLESMNYLVDIATNNITVFLKGENLEPNKLILYNSYPENQKLNVVFITLADFIEKL